MHEPKNIQLIGNEVAIVWDDGTESYFTGEKLRAASPSAETQGERDIFGQKYGGDGPKKFDGVTVLSWARIGNYAIQFRFSDGHSTGSTATITSESSPTPDRVLVFTTKVTKLTKVSIHTK